MSQTDTENQVPTVQPKSRALKVLKPVLYTLGILLLLLTFILSPWGTRFSVWVASSSVDALDIEYQQGGIFSDLVLPSIRWQQDDTVIHIHDLTLDLSFRCVFSANVCVEYLEITRLNVQLHPSESEKSEPSSAPALITMPVPLIVNKVSIHQADILVPDVIKLRWDTFDTQLKFDQRLVVDTFQLAGLSVNTFANDGTAVAAAKPQNSQAFDFSQFEYQAIQSLPVVLPLHFDIKQFLLTDTSVLLAEQPLQRIPKISLKMQGDSQRLTIQELELVHANGELSVQGDIGLAGKLAHDLVINGDFEFDATNSVQASLVSKGDIDGLNALITSTGLVTTRTELQAELSNPRLPLNLSVSWQALGWPLLDPQIRSQSGEVSVKGDLTDFALSMRSSVSGDTLPENQISLEGKGAWFEQQKQVNLSELVVATLGGKISSQGQLKVTKHLDWQGHTRIEKIDLAKLATGYPATLNGDLQLAVNNQQGVWRSYLSQIAIDGQWQGYPLSVVGKAFYDQVKGVRVDGLSLNSADNSLTLDGTLDSENNLSFDFALIAPDVSQTVPNVAGEVNLEGRLGGTLENPQLNYQVRGQKLSIADIDIAQVGADGDLTWDDAKPVGLDLSVSDIVIAGQQISQGNLKVSGDAQSHQLQVNATGNQLDLQLVIDGQLSLKGWQGQWQSANISSRFSDLVLDAPFDIQANWSEQSYLIGAHCWQDENGSLCINELSFAEQQAKWQLVLDEYDWTNLLAKLSLDIPSIETDSRLDIATQGVWSQDNGPVLTFELGLTPSIFKVGGDQGVTSNLSQFELTGSADQKNLNTKLSIVDSVLGEVALALSASSELLTQDLNQPIQGSFALSGIDFSEFETLVPQLDKLKGKLKGQGQLNGTLQQPQVTGQLSLLDGAFAGDGIPISLSEVSQTITLRGQVADFDGQYRFGQGYGQLSGDISWLPELKGKLHLQGQNLEMDYEDMVKARISPDIKVAFAPENIDVTGTVTLPYARVKIRELPPGSVSPSDDVILVEEQDKQQAAQQHFNMDVLISIDPRKANDVKLDAYGLTSDLRGDLRIENNAKGMFANGELNLVNGRYRGNGQNLIIRDGNIAFNGTLDRPYLDIEAIRDPKLTEDGVIAGLRVQGEAERPKVTIFSEPEMEQQQSLSYMITGRGIGESSDDSQDTVITNALLSIGLGQSENLVSKVGNKLGFEDVAFDTSGQGDETQLSLSGTIAPGLKLRYGVGVFDSVSEVAIRYELLPKLYLEAISGVSNAIDLYYEFSLEGSQNQKLLRADSANTSEK